GLPEGRGSVVREHSGRWLEGGHLGDTAARPPPCHRGARAASPRERVFQLLRLCPQALCSATVSQRDLNRELSLLTFQSLAFQIPQYTLLRALNHLGQPCAIFVIADGKVRPFLLDMADGRQRGAESAQHWAQLEDVSAFQTKALRH